MKTLLFVLLMLCALKFSAYAQNDSTGLKTIVSKLEKQTNTFPVEKVYLHFNKPDYSIGDTIWFKAYLTIGPLHQPSALSGILYVDLINGDNKFAKSLKLKVIGGIALGQMALTETLLPGNYRIRAYTTWMRNMDAGYFFERNITIGNPKYNAVFVNSTYKVNAGQVNACLVYTDKFARPYANKIVSYTIKADTATVYKSTGTTDAHGVLNVSFPAQAKNNQKANHITTSIKLFNSVVVDKSIPLSVFDSSIDIQFFPEGGQWLNGVRSKVGFKATGVNGLGVDVKGVVIDNDNNVVAYISSKHLGMGYFAMMPQSGKTYKAKITLPDSSETTVKLPDAAEKGYVLAVDNRDSVNLQVRVSTNAATFQEKQNTLFLLVGQSAGVVYYTTAQKLDNPVFTATIPKSKFPTGIVQFTLFSATLEPLNERIAFIQNNDLLNLNLITNKSVFGPRDPVDLNLSAKDKDNKPVIGSFSLTVFNDDETPAGNEHTILSNLLLTSDLKGYIEQPNYYFEPINNQTQADLDVLMLTQGYRRFSWPAVIAGPEPLIAYKPEKFTDISGTLTTPSGKPVPKGKVSVTSPLDKIKVDTATDEKGKFSFNGIEFPDSTKLIIQASRSNDGKNVNISLDGRTAPAVFKNNSIGDESLILQATQAAYVSNNDDSIDSLEIIEESKTKVLKQIDIKGTKTSAPSIYNNYGTVAQYHAKMEQLRDENSVFSALEWRVPGINYKDRRLYYEGSRLAVRVNGVPSGQNYLQLLDPHDIESVTIIATSPPLAMITTKAFAGTDTIQLKEVKIKGKKTEHGDLAPWAEKLTNSSNLNGPGHADQIVMGDKLLDCITLSECLTSKVFGVTNRNGKIYSNRQLALNFGMNVQPMVLIVDGAMLDMGTIDNINVRDIESIEVLISNSYLAIYGSTASSGALVINLKKGKVNDNSFAFESVPGVIYTTFKGFNKPRQFYTPKYDVSKTNDQIFDSRTAVYWNPYVITGVNGASKVQFYNSDVKGSYRVVVEGIDNTGNIGRYVYRYKVE